MRQYHEFKVNIGNNAYDTMIDIDLLSIESIEKHGVGSLLHMDSGMHIETYLSKKEVREILDKLNQFGQL
jgi:hypothetical protein